MSNVLPQNRADLVEPCKTLILRYAAENDEFFLVSDPNGVRMAVPKNRSVPEPFPDKPLKPLTPAFRLLALAFLGLAPAGLGTLILAPLAALWALVVLITRSLSPGDQSRVAIVWGLTIVLLGIAIPMSSLFFSHLVSK